jgi:hypothetical protein
MASATFRRTSFLPAKPLTAYNLPVLKRGDTHAGIGPRRCGCVRVGFRRLSRCLIRRLKPGRAGITSLISMAAVAPCAPEQAGAAIVTATVTFSVGTSPPASSFYLQQSNEFDSETIYLSETTVISPPPASLPGSPPLAILGTAILALAVDAVMRRGKATKGLHHSISFRTMTRCLPLVVVYLLVAAISPAAAQSVVTYYYTGSPFTTFNPIGCPGSATPASCLLYNTSSLSPGMLY